MMRCDDAAAVLSMTKYFWGKRTSKGSSCFVYVSHGVPTCLYKNINIWAPWWFKAPMRNTMFVFFLVSSFIISLPSFPVISVNCPVYTKCLKDLFKTLFILPLEAPMIQNVVRKLYSPLHKSIGIHLKFIPVLKSFLYPH